MISSRLKAPRYGRGRECGRLIVDGTDMIVFRKAVVAFKPRSDGQRRRLLAVLGAAWEVYNAALQERRDAYAHPSQTRVSVVNQFLSLTTVRHVRPDVFEFGLQPLRWSIRRVDEAFVAFFRRVREGQKPGYPRFKSQRRFDTVGYDEPVSWRLDLRRRVLTVQGVGEIRLSKSAARQLNRYAARGGAPTTLTLTRTGRDGRAWRAAIGFKNLTPHTRTEPTAGRDSLVGLDRGVTVPVAVAAGQAAGVLLDLPIDVRTRLDRLRRRIEELQQQRAAKKKYGRAWRTLSKKIKRCHGKAAHVQENWARHTAKQLTAAHAVLVLEDLNLPAMTRSAKGTIDQPGTNVKAKAGLNRLLAEAAPGKLARWVHVKAEEAGRRIWIVPPAYTSQQCSACRHVDAASRINRHVYYCGRCGHYEHADINAARVIAARGAAAEAAWAAAGSQPLVRPKPRMRRHNADDTPLGAAQAAA